ncbi:hypothetical protein E2C01_050368 [Portunus trituberculatus]|uniref:Uncharacterized protein n=1 Tax=Portunus trituberculatus TaxID=210409 RepID=A0A5B7GH46_PORTR|nr:hypothetical protein [Portunus trituberculatus]
MTAPEIRASRASPAPSDAATMDSLTLRKLHRNTSTRLLPYAPSYSPPQPRQASVSYQRYRKRNIQSGHSTYTPHQTRPAPHLTPPAPP